MSDTNTADGTVETPTVEELQARLTKAEAKIVDLKKNPTTEAPITETPEPIIDTSKFLTRDELEKEKFFTTNSDLKEYEEDLKSYVDKWNSWEDAKFLLERNDPTFWNRAKTNSMNLTNWDSSSEKTTYTREELIWLTDAEYNVAKDAIDAWKAKMVW